MELTVIQNIKKYEVQVIQNTKNYEVIVETKPIVRVLEIAQLGAQGVPGLSAYELDVKNGYVGSEQEWLAQLSKKVPELTGYFSCAIPDNSGQVVQVDLIGLDPKNNYTLKIISELADEILDGLYISLMPFQKKDKAFIYINNNTGGVLNLDNIEFVLK